ncbi:TPA: hypothetical protein ACOJP0_000001, partial [Vibrio harveyi]
PRLRTKSFSLKQASRGYLGIDHYRAGTKKEQRYTKHGCSFSEFLFSAMSDANLTAETAAKL